MRGAPLEGRGREGRGGEASPRVSNYLLVRMRMRDLSMYLQHARFDAQGE